MLFIDCYTTWCANSSETGQDVLGRACATPIIQTFSQGQVDWGVCETSFGKPDSTEWTFNLIRLSNKNILCQQPSGNSHPPAGLIQGLDSFRLRLDWHLLASIMGLKEPQEQSWQETELQQRKRWKESPCITSKQQRMLHGNKLHSNKWGTRMVI